VSVKLFDSTKTLLGEGPRWSKELAALCWVDILDNKVLVKSEHDAEAKLYLEFNAPSSITNTAGSTLEVVDAEGVWLLDCPTGQKALKFPIPQGHSENRSNESQRDPFGNLWIGRMNRNDALRTGELLCINPSGEISVEINDMGIPNTLVWDEARGRMYFADSSEGTIYMAPTTNGKPDFGLRETFSQLDEKFGAPDGSAITHNGHLFNARWGAGCVLEFDPSGQVVRSIEIPASQVTSCALNSDESILYVTSASIGLDSNDELDGATFAVTL